MDNPSLAECIELTRSYQAFLCQRQQVEPSRRGALAAYYREQLAVAWERRRQELARRRWGGAWYEPDRVTHPGTRAGRKNLTPEQVRAIRRRVDEQRLRTGRLPRGLQAELAREFDVAVSTVNDIIHGRSHVS